MLPNSAITTTMVSNELGISSKSVSALCSNPNIKWFAASKPRSIRNAVLYSVIAPRSSVSSSGPGGGELADTSYSWMYTGPIGGAEDPYRLGDFRGYDHAAKDICLVSLPDTMSFSTMGNPIDKTCIVNRPTASLLGLVDFTTDTPYIGVKVTGNDGSYFMYNTLAAGARDLEVDFNHPVFYLKLAFQTNVTVSVFLCDKSIPSWTSTIPSNMKVWLPVKTVSKTYARIEGNPSNFPSANLSNISILPSSVAWGNTNDVYITVTASSKDGTDLVCGMSLEITSYLDYVSTMYPDFNTNFTWTNNGNGTYTTTPIRIYNTLILNTNGDPITPSGIRTALIAVREKMYVSGKWVYTDANGTNVDNILLNRG